MRAQLIRVLLDASINMLLLERFLSLTTSPQIWEGLLMDMEQ
jgi:hypothetical protein